MLAGIVIGIVSNKIVYFIETPFKSLLEITVSVIKELFAENQEAITTVKSEEATNRVTRVTEPSTVVSNMPMGVSSRMMLVGRNKMLKNWELQMYS
jgi:hypothetical protein